jgi:hypothetical protein
MITYKIITSRPCPKCGADVAQISVHITFDTFSQIWEVVVCFGCASVWSLDGQSGILMSLLNEARGSMPKAVSRGWMVGVLQENYATISVREKVRNVVFRR